jgi:hypothetical protein
MFAYRLLFTLYAPQQPLPLGFDPPPVKGAASQVCNNKKKNMSWLKSINKVTAIGG